MSNKIIGPRNVSTLLDVFASNKKGEGSELQCKVLLKHSKGTFITRTERLEFINKALNIADIGIECKTLLITAKEQAENVFKDLKEYDDFLKKSDTTKGDLYFHKNQTSWEKRDQGRKHYFLVLAVLDHKGNKLVQKALASEMKKLENKGEPDEEDTLPTYHQFLEQQQEKTKKAKKGKMAKKAKDESEKKNRQVEGGVEKDNQPIVAKKPDKGKKANKVKKGVGKTTPQDPDITPSNKKKKASKGGKLDQAEHDVSRARHDAVVQGNDGKTPGGSNKKKAGKGGKLNQAEHDVSRARHDAVVQGNGSKTPSGGKKKKVVDKAEKGKKKAKAGKK